MPLVEESVVGIWHLAVRALAVAPFLPAVPLVEDFVGDIQAQFVADVVDHRGEGVVAQADSVAADLLQLLEAVFPDFSRYCASEAGCILVEAYSLNLFLDSVHRHSVFAVEADIPQAYAHLLAVHQLTFAEQLADESIKIR